jgi:hypothetical protein
MKKIICSFIFLAVSAAFVNAKVWRVNNNNGTGVVADFNNIQAAVDAAAAGDTIYIEGSAIVYSGPRVQKRLVFIGSGYFLTGTGSNQGLQANTNVTQVNSFAIDSSASGSVFLGIGNLGLNTNNVNGYGADNITVSRCYVGYGIRFLQTAGTAGMVAENWSITKCYFDGNLDVYGMILKNWNVSNNIFNINSAIYMHNLINEQCIVRNNVFNSNTLNFYNDYFANNIITNGAGLSILGSVVKNNLAVGNPAPFSSFAGTNGNQWGFTAAQLFQGLTGNSTDGQFRLASGSPAIGAGLPVGSVTSIDAGAFGGPDPYILSGIPNIPSIYNLTVPATVPAGQTINVTYSTRSTQ